MQDYYQSAEQTLLLCDDKSQLQLDVIHQFLTQSYWSKGIAKSLVVKAIENSLTFAVYQQTKKQVQQVAFARVITDKSSFAYLADVFVLPEFRQLGVATALIKFLLQHKDLQGLRRFMLCTKDAHNLYQKFGFSQINQPAMMMQIHQKNLYL